MTEIKNPAAYLGRLGGSAVLKKYGREHFVKMSGARKINGRNGKPFTGLKIDLIERKSA